MIFKVILSIALLVAISDGYRNRNNRNRRPNPLFPADLNECPNRIFEAKHVCNYDPDSEDGPRMCAGEAEEYRDSSNTQPTDTATVIFWDYNYYNSFDVSNDGKCRSSTLLRRFTCNKTDDNFWKFNCDEDPPTYAPHDPKNGHLYIREL